MHDFIPRWDDSTEDDCPDIGTLVFTDTLDVVDYCERNRVALWRNWPEIWHLDDDGRFRCYTRGGSFHSSVRDYAAAPRYLFHCRETSLGYECPDRWVIIEPRHEWHDHYAVTEADAAAFVRLQKSCKRRGVTLLDVLILNQEPRWWSLRELTTGSTAWPAPRRRRRGLTLADD
jgi:hypothetical protein